MFSKVKSTDLAAFMLAVEDHTKSILARISAINREIDRKMIVYNHIASAILQSTEKSTSTEDNSQESSEYRAKNEKMMEQLESLADEIKMQLKEKSSLAVTLYNKFADSGEEFEDFLEADLNQNEGSEANTFIKESLGSEEITEIIITEQFEQVKDACICKGQQHHESMIKCESGICKARWYHLKCLNLTKKAIPKKKWICPTCKQSQ